MKIAWLGILLLAGATAPQDPPEAAAAVQALLQLKDGDEDGFDTQADILTKLGGSALDAIEAGLRKAGPKAGFPLQRIKDMIWYPLNIKGAITSRAGDAEKEAKLGVGVGTIFLSFDGQAVTNNHDYTELLHAAEKAGKTTAKVEVLHQGRRKTVQIDGLRFGGQIETHPGPMAHYLHQGHREFAWDQAVREGLAPWNDESSDLIAEKLGAAVRSGCRDPLVLAKALRALINKGQQAEVLKLWKLASADLRATLYAGLWTRHCQYEAALASLLTGNVAQARELEEKLIEACDAAEDRSLGASSRVVLGILLEKDDPKLSVSLIKRGMRTFDELQMHSCWHHDALMHVLRGQSRWDDVAGFAGQYGLDKQSAPAPMSDGLAWMGRFQNHTLSGIPARRLYPTEAAARENRPGGLTAEYFPQLDLKGTPMTRVDPGVDFRWGTEAPLHDFPQDNFSIRWSGFVEPEFTDTYTFTTRTDDGVRLWIDGKLIIDKWIGQSPTWWSGTIELTKGKKVPIKMEYYDSGFGAQAELYWDSPSFGHSEGAGPWSVVYRQTFTAPAVRYAFQSLPGPQFRQEEEAVRGKAFLLGGRGSRSVGTSWAAYDSVRVEAVLRLTSAERGWDSKAGLRACIDEARQTEVGFAWTHQHDVKMLLYRNRESRGFWNPRLDVDVRHRVALEVHQGQAMYFIDGKMVDVQFIPGHWSGTCGLEIGNSPVEMELFEISVPSRRILPPDQIRDLYDRAEEFVVAGKLGEALDALEAAAALQPRVEDLGRLYAAYLVAGHSGRKMLSERLLKVTDPQVARALMAAEEQLGFIEHGDQGSFQRIWRVKNAVQSGFAADPQDMTALKSSADPGELSIFAWATELQCRRSQGPSWDDAEQACLRGITQDPKSTLHQYRLWRIRTDQKKDGPAAEAATNLKVLLPNVAPGELRKLDEP